MNEALDYIDLHLYDEIDHKELERITGTSIYHFRRMFSFLSGMPLGEYIRSRKLSNATFDLQQDRKSTRLNSSHVAISYAVFCLKKKKKVDSTEQDSESDVT